jgi:hypothetical protein
MNKPKLSLDELEVESFVTTLDAQRQEQAEGGTSTPCSVATVVVASVVLAVEVTYITYTLTQQAYSAITQAGTANPEATPCPINTGTRIVGRTGC